MDKRFIHSLKQAVLSKEIPDRLTSRVLSSALLFGAYHAKVKSGHFQFLAARQERRCKVTATVNLSIQPLSRSTQSIFFLPTRRLVAPDFAQRHFYPCLPVPRSVVKPAIQLLCSPENFQAQAIHRRPAIVRINALLKPKPCHRLTKPFRNIDDVSIYRQKPNHWNADVR